MFNGGVALGFVLLIISSVIYAIVLFNEQLESDDKERTRVINLSVEERQRYYDGITIDYTILVGEDSRKSVGSSAIRSAVGGALLGPVGLIAGAISGKNNNSSTFTIIYKSGRKEVKTVENNSSEFEQFAKYLR